MPSSSTITNAMSTGVAHALGIKVVFASFAVMAELFFLPHEFDGLRRRCHCKNGHSCNIKWGQELGLALLDSSVPGKLTRSDVAF